MIERIRQAAAKRILYLPHAVERMSSHERMITIKDVEVAIFHGRLVEIYEDDPRGASCLVLGFSNGRPIHVVCSPKEEFLAIITVYIPAPERWNNEFTARK